MAELQRFATVNDNIMCSIAITTTGDDPRTDELLEVAFIPMWDGKRHETAKLLELMLMPNDKTYPKRPTSQERGNQHYRADHFSYVLPKTFEICIRSGMDTVSAADGYDNWFEKLPFPRPGRRIIPLCYDWNYLYRFLVPLLGQKTVDLQFHYQARDLLVMACYDNDYCGITYNEAAYKRPNANYFFTELGLPEFQHAAAIERANYQILAYREMMTRRKSRR